MYFAHEAEAAHGELMNTLNNVLQKPGIAFTVETIIIFGLALGSYWLLKKYTRWQFPINKKEGK